MPLPAPKECRVLVVDDNHDIAETLGDFLELQGFQVRVAYDGNEGLEASREFCPHIGFLDIGMPGMDGYELARQLRAEAGRSVYLVAVTGWGSPEQKREAFDAGFDTHCTKPADPGRLVQLALAHCA